MSATKEETPGLGCTIESGLVDIVSLLRTVTNARSYALSETASRFITYLKTQQHAHVCLKVVVGILR